MNCLKCGREIDEGQYFCGDCLLVMEKYPVKPGASVQLPPRADSIAPKKAHPKRRGKAAPEEQVKALKIRVRVLSAVLAVCLILLIVFSVLTIKDVREKRLLPGQNYSSANSIGNNDGD